MLINSRASSWLQNLIAHNYSIQIDLSNHNVELIDSFNLQNEAPAQLIYNIVYLINSVQEYNAHGLDKYGRFPYEASLQSKLGIHKKNVAHELIGKLLNHHGENLIDQPSKIVISHDIDTLHSGFVYEFYRGLRTMDIPLMMRVLISLVYKKSLWWNLDSIIKLLDDYDFKSIFYFLVEQGRTSDGIKNADYNINNPKIKSFIDRAERNGYEIGLHKSTFDYSFDYELEKLGVEAVSNRHHYLKFVVPDKYKHLDTSTLKTDSSLCFPYDMGFRNSYGLPFQPFDLKSGKTYDILEIPFQIMDIMFPNRHAKDAKVSSKIILDFIDANRNNAILGMLWHNTDLSEVSKKHSVTIFKNILQYLYETKMEVVTPSQVYADYIG